MSTVASGMAVSAAGTYDFVLTDVAQGVEIENWQISNEALGIAAPFTSARRRCTAAGRKAARW